MCTAVLIGWDPATPPLPPHLDSYYEALLVNKDRRHLFVTPCLYLFVNEQPVPHFSGYSRLLGHQFCELPVQTLVQPRPWYLWLPDLPITETPVYPFLGNTYSCTFLSLRLLFNLYLDILDSGTYLSVWLLSSLHLNILDFCTSLSVTPVQPFPIDIFDFCPLAFSRFVGTPSLRGSWLLDLPVS